MLTPTVYCTITAITGKSLRIRLSGNVQPAADMPVTTDKLAKKLGPVTWDAASLAELLLGNTSPDVFETECHRWIAAVAAKQDEGALEDTQTDIRQHCLDVLELSDMLLHCDMRQREVLEHRFTVFIEQADYYLQALRIVNGTSAEFTGLSADDYVSALIDKLGKSGYVYHLRRRFYMMLCIFVQDFSVMERAMPAIIRLLLSHDVQLFRCKPFGAMWTQLLEYFIRKVSRDGDRLSTDTALCRMMIQVLVLQQNIAGSEQDGIYDSVLNHSLLYRLCTRMNVADPRRLLEESLYCLVSDESSLASYAVDATEAERAANQIASLVTDTISDMVDPVHYDTCKASLLIRNGVITLSAADVTPSNLYVPLPQHMGLWHGLSIRLSEKPTSDIRGNKSNTISRYKRLWDFIGKSIFDAHRPKAVQDQPRLLPGEEVGIIVTVQRGDSLVFDCRVIGEGLEHVTGTLDAVHDLVPYYPGKLTVDDFCYNGFPLILTAKADIDDNGKYVFRMRDFLEEYMEEYRIEKLDYNSHLVCYLNTAPPGALRAPAVSEEGLCVSVGIAPHANPNYLSPGRVVEVCQPQEGPAPYINATYLDVLKGRKWSMAMAVHRLLLNYSGAEVYHDDDEESQTDVTTLERSHVLELVKIIESYAATEDDYIKTYNYIAFCRLLCKMLGDEREEYYVKRLQLLELLNDFALNNAFTSPDNLALLTDEASAVAPGSPLYQDYRKMLTVSWLNSEEHDEELCRESMDHDHPDLRQLASLVLSHNFVKKAGLIQQADEILNKIRTLLKLRRNGTDKKYYGRETYTTEFKTSLVYPEYSMRADLAAQSRKILSEICAFLNADGGTLYLGVNDQGYEVGLEEDLKYPQFQGSTDRYEDYLQNLITQKLSQEAAHLVKMHYDTGTKQDVLVIEVSPSADPIKLDGDYYERMGKSARKVNDNYLPMFFANRHQWAAEHKLTTREEAQVAMEKEAEAILLATQSTAQQTDESTNQQTTKPANRIPTSHFRSNVLHSYEEGYIPVVGYICFIDGDSYKVIEHDDYKEDDYRLELAVHDDELQDELIMVYASGKAVRVNVREIMERPKDRIFKRYAGEDLVFATIARTGDYLCVGYVDGRDNHRVRFDSISRLEETSMQDDGTAFTTVPNRGLHYVDVVRPDLLPSWVQANPKATDLGIVLKTVNGRELAELLTGCEVG